MAQYFVKHRVNFTFYFHLSFHSQQVFRYLKHPLLWDPYVPLLLTQNPSSEPHFYPVSVSANKKSLWKTLRGLRTNSLKVRDKMCGNWDLRLSRRWRFGCWSSGFIRRVTLEVLTNVSEEPTASVYSSETSVNTSNITRRINPEGHYLNLHHCGNLKSQYYCQIMLSPFL